MPLHIDVTGIKDWESFCKAPEDADETHRSWYGNLSAAAASIGFSMMTTTIGELKNEDDCYEHYIRIKAFAGISGSYTKYEWLTMDLLRKHIGLRTNVGRREPRASWFKRISDLEIRDRKWTQRRKLEAEAQKQEVDA